MLITKTKINNKIVKIIYKHDLYYIIEGGVNILHLCVSLTEARAMLEAMEYQQNF